MEVLKKIQWVPLVAIILVIRGFFDFSLGQALLAGVVFAFWGYVKWLKFNEEKDLAEKISRLEDAIKETDNIKKEVTELRANLSGLMIKNASRPQEMKQTLDNRRMF